MREAVLHPFISSRGGALSPPVPAENASHLYYCLLPTAYCLWYPQQRGHVVEGWRDLHSGDALRRVRRRRDARQHEE